MKRVAFFDFFNQTQPGLRDMQQHHALRASRSLRDLNACLAVFQIFLLLVHVAYIGSFAGFLKPTNE